MKFKLEVLSAGKAEGKSIPITSPQFFIGRDPQCQLRPASPMISKKHCALVVKDGKAYIKDFGSTNGTFVNEEQVKNARQLKNDDILKIGPLEFKVCLEELAVVKKTPESKEEASLDTSGSEIDSTKQPKTSADNNEDTKEEVLVSSTDDTSVEEGDLDDEDSIASLLMDLSADDETISSLSSEDGLADTTQTEIPQVNSEDGEESEKPSEEEAEGKAKKPDGKEQKANTASAAAAILQKYARRGRN